MNFDKDHPRDKIGRFISKEDVEIHKDLMKKNIKTFNSDGSLNKDKLKGLNKKEIEIIDSFEQINSHRSLNEISYKINNGISVNEIKEQYSEKRFNDYINVDNHIKLSTPYKGEITRLIRDDNDIYKKLNVGDEMNFDRLTNFGEKGNEFKIKGGNLRIHIENNTRGVSVKNLMPFKEESEVLLNPGKYKIVKKVEKNINHIYLEEI
ncbi:MAG: hypothetical protein PHE51_04865 [Eubacteriales bacterium]|nr:hypothetical protein [Eubacteriales bacterium]